MKPLEKELNKKCLWKEVAENDQDKKEYKTLGENSPCHLCHGYRINTCDKYLPKDTRFYE